MSRFFTSYWTPDPWEHGAGYPIGHAASNEFAKRGVAVGDSLYIVHQERRELFLGGRLTVGRLLTYRDAQEHFGKPDVWPANDHVLAKAGTEQRLDPSRVVPREMLPQLTFARPDGTYTGLRLDADGAANQQTLRTVRELTPDSARMLDDLIAMTSPAPFE